MKTVFVIMTFSILLMACADEQTYKFTLKDKEKKTEVFKADNDTSAYETAFIKYCIALNVHKKMLAEHGETYSKSYDEPTGFILKNENNHDISDIDFTNRRNLEDSIKNIFTASSTAAIKSGANIGSQIDSSIIKSLLSKFIQIKDEFSKSGKVSYIPKSAPKYVNQNGIYLGFSVINGVPDILKICIQHEGDSWLFIEKVQFSVDGVAFEYIPTNVKRDSGYGGRIWEWMEDSIYGYEDLILAIADGKQVKMKLVGDSYYKIKNLNSAQISSFATTIELYKAMGGKI